VWLIRPRTILFSPVLDRSSLVLGTDKPGPTNTGIIPGSTLTAYNGDLTCAPNTIYENLDIFGRVTSNVANSGLRNCRVRGKISTLSTYSALINCLGNNNSNFLIESCELTPDVPDYRWDGIYGHDFTVKYTNIHHVQDGMQIKWGARVWPFPTGVVVEQNWIHDLAWWTYFQNGTVHPNDTNTHNDPIQHMQGYGTKIRGNTINGEYARQYGHWYVVDPNTEPYVQVARNSLNDGLDGPWQDIFTRDVYAPTEGSGPNSNSANGKYNAGDLSVMIIGAEPDTNNLKGPSFDITFEDNWCSGGYIAINGNANFRPGSPSSPVTTYSGENLGSFKRNKFEHNTGAQGGTANLGGTKARLMYWPNSYWSAAYVDIPATGPNANVYRDSGAYIALNLGA
jgi:hypothetical protein